MELQRAIEQISEIHAHVLRAEVFRGYRAVTMASTSALAMLTAVLAATGLRGAGIATALLPWVAYAGVSALICAADLTTHCLLRGSRARQQAVLVVGQFVPSLVAGSIATALLLPAGPSTARLLPGLWTVLFGLGIFASLPYLPRALGWVAAFYVGAGAVMLWAAIGGGLPLHWALGTTFGGGQAAAAWILYHQLERPTGRPQPTGGFGGHA